MLPRDQCRVCGVGSDSSDFGVGGQGVGEAGEQLEGVCGIVAGAPFFIFVVVVVCLFVRVWTDVRAWANEDFVEDIKT